MSDMAFPLFIFLILAHMAQTYSNTVHCAGSEISMRMRPAQPPQRLYYVPNRPIYEKPTHSGENWLKNLPESATIGIDGFRQNIISAAEHDPFSG
ncbi:MAG: hypothetical protein P4L75_01000 [Clostridia bacterium]|nr:hypothetical protein [Clostridia bacterium]MDR3645465.1 hypothetical protein [Clostridia bacterium]